MTLTENTNHVEPRKPGRPPKQAPQTVADAQAAYDAACKRTADAKKARARAGAKLADASAAYNQAKDDADLAATEYRSAMAAELAAEETLRKAEGETK